jgi:membrane associated rhomboid family serine protease
MLTERRTVALWVVLSLAVLMTLTRVSPHWTAARAAYQVTVRSKEELDNIIVWSQTYGSLNTTAYSYSETTPDANYTVTTQSGKLAGTNTTVTTLSLSIRRLRAGGEVSATFPLVPLGLKDVNINGSLAIFPTVQSNQISRIGEITTKVTILSNSGFLLYSYYDTATVSGGQIKWSVFPEEKNLSVFSLQLTFALLSFLAAGLVLLPFSARLRHNFPYASFAASAAMFGIYALVGTGDDVFSQLGSSRASQIAELLLSPLLHASFSHVAGNIFLGLLISGSLIEAWLRRKIGSVAYAWLIAGYFLSVVFSIFTDGVGASLWVIALSVVLLEYLSDGRLELTRGELMISMLAGFAIIQATYSYVVELVVFYYNEFSRDTGITHLLFLGLALVVVHFALRISESKAKISGYLRKIRVIFSG